MTLRFFFYIVMTLLLTISFTMRRFTSAIDRQLVGMAACISLPFLCSNEIQELRNSAKWSAFTEIKLWLI